MAGTEALCHMPEGHARVIAPTWFQRFRGLMVVTVGQIEKPLGNAGGGAVGRHIDERHRDLRHRLVAGESEMERHIAGGLQRRGKRSRLENRAADIVETLVDRLIARSRVGTSFTAGAPDGERRVACPSANPCASARRRCADRAAGCCART